MSACCSKHENWSSSHTSTSRKRKIQTDRENAPLSRSTPRYSLKSARQESRQYPIGCLHQNWLQIGPWHRKARRAECSSAYRLNGRIFLPNFVKQGVNIWFAVDNIDFSENTPTGQNTFHGKVIVLKQRAEDGETVKKNHSPSHWPKAPDSSVQVGFEVKYCEQLVIKSKHGNRTKLISNDYTHT